MSKRKPGAEERPPSPQETVCNLTVKTILDDCATTPSGHTGPRGCGFMHGLRITTSCPARGTGRARIYQKLFPDVVVH